MNSPPTVSPSTRAMPRPRIWPLWPNTVPARNTGAASRRCVMRWMPPVEARPACPLTSRWLAWIDRHLGNGAHRLVHHWSDDDLERQTAKIVDLIVEFEFAFLQLVLDDRGLA